MTRLSDVELLERLVAFDTVSDRSNLPLVDFLCDYLDRRGVQLIRNAAPDEPKANLIALLGPAPRAELRHGLVLSGHMDVVPADEEEWQSDPFTLTRRGTDLFGRGTADMKGFLAVATNLFAATPAESLTAPLALLFTYDEEVGTIGAKHLVDSWLSDHPLPRHVVVGEPTELAAVRLHKGHLKARFTVFGVSAHSAYPHLGHNAVEPAGRLIGALAELRRRLEDERLPSSLHFPEVPFPTLNVARIAGGSAINVVPDRAVVEVGVRLLPGLEAAVVAAQLQQVGEGTLKGERWQLELLAESPPMELAPQAPVFQRLAQRLGQTGSPSVDYATDAGWLQRADLDCVLFGPGSIRLAHKPNEHVPEGDLDAAGVVLADLVGAFCQSDDPG